MNPTPVTAVSSPPVRHRQRALEAAGGEVELHAPDQAELNDSQPSSSRKLSPGQWVGVGLALGLTGLGIAGSMIPWQGQPPAVAVSQDGPQATTLTREIVAARDGQLLSSGRILKVDQYPELLKNSPLQGAPNYRQVSGTSIHGVAQPTVDGLRAVLRDMGADQRPVMWTTMREEPVLYLDGTSITLRDLKTPIYNLEQPGISGAGVEAQEIQLKGEVLREAARNGGRILIHDEAEDGTIVARWVEVSEANLQTPAEVFAQMQREGFQVDYARVPVTDEKAPEEKDFDALVQRLKDVPAGTPTMFNCHAGRGRTTTAMVIAELLQNAQKQQSLSRNSSVREDIREQADYQAGEYRVILSLIRLLEQGTESKHGVDETIDRHAALQNLRTAIEKYKLKAEAGDPEAQQRGQDYLKRYFYLISFNEYVKEQAPQGFKVTFQEWMKAHPQFQTMLENLQLAMGLVPAPDQPLLTPGPGVQLA